MLLLDLEKLDCALDWIKREEVCEKTGVKKHDTSNRKFL